MVIIGFRKSLLSDLLQDASKAWNERLVSLGIPRQLPPELRTEKLPSQMDPVNKGRLMI